MSNEQPPTGRPDQNRRPAHEDMVTGHTWHRASSAPDGNRRFQSTEFQWRWFSSRKKPQPQPENQQPLQPQPHGPAQNQFQWASSQQAAASMSQGAGSEQSSGQPQSSQVPTAKKPGPFRRGVGFIASLTMAGLLLIIMGKALFISPILARFPIEKDCTVENTHIQEIIDNSSSGGRTTYRYWVETRECGRLEIPSIWTYGVWKSDEIFAKVQIGHTYRMGLFNGDALSVLPDATNIAWIRDDANGGRYL